MQEIWKDVKGYEGLYMVSNTGKVKSLDRYDNIGRLQHGKIISTKTNNRGYLQIHLFKNGKCFMKLLHRVVAEAFIENPDNKKTVNHIDENKENNCVTNLEWLTHKENDNYGTRNIRFAENRNQLEIGKKISKRINQYEVDGKLINSFYGVKEAERRTGICESNIRKSMRRNYKAGGYIWKYA